MPCYFSDEGQHGLVLFRNRNHFFLWLTGVVVCAVGGWRFGHSLKSWQAPDKDSQSASSAHVSSVSGLAPGSPRALWMERMKAGKVTDFPQLIAEWDELFPYDKNYENGITPNAEAALRWAYGVWMVKDLDGFLQASGDGSFYPMWAAEVMAELMPDTAYAMLTEPQTRKPHAYFLEAISAALAEQHPLLYLSWNPEGIKEISEHHSTSDDWVAAIASLAKTDAVAAGNACLQWKVGNHPDGIFTAFQAVVAGWKPSHPPIDEWVNGIADPQLRNFAKHAWLCVLAEQDPHAALRALDAAKLTHHNDLNQTAPGSIIYHLAESDPMAALKLLRETETFFAQDTTSIDDPFAVSNVAYDPFADPPQAAPVTEEPEPPGNPFEEFFHGSIRDNGMRLRVLAALAEKLPRDPAGLIAGIRELTAEAGGDAAWQRSITAQLISRESGHWSAEDCLAVAAIWASDASAPDDDSILEKLATRAAQANPETALTQLPHFPGQMRGVLLAKIIANIPASDIARRTELLRQLPQDQWTSEIGQALGQHASDYASFIAEVPVDPSKGALDSFASQWGEEHPEAAAAWLNSLPNRESAASAAAGLATSWFRYDPDAAIAWAESLPSGAVRDVAMKKKEEYVTKHGDSSAP